MSFGRLSGRTRMGACHVCGEEVQTEEHERFMGNDGWVATEWMPVMHRAPCGAHCSGGGYHHGETDVHIVPFESCPRCGETDSEVVQIMTNEDESERVLIHRYKHKFNSDMAFRIDLETHGKDGWERTSSWPLSDNESLKEAYSWAARYVDWL